MPDTIDVVREVVRDLVRKPVRDDQALVSSGLIDSLSVVTLIAALEERLQIRIPAADVQPDDFDSIVLIVDTIARVSPP
jgi:methoxymalonate biosynthesis acyl carrier protein